MAKKKSKKKLIIIISIFVICIAVIIIFFSTKGDKPVNVTISKVEKRTITQTVSAVGKIQPETEVKISSETSGEIIYLSLKEGDPVKSGDLLVKIKPDIIETQLEQYKAAIDASEMEIEARKAEVERTKQDLERISELYKKKFSSKQEFDGALSAYDQAEAGYKGSLARLEQSRSAYKQVKRSAERTIIYAPINGVITKLSVEKGEKVVGVAQMQGTEMMTVADLSVMNAEVEVDENDIVLVKVGDTTKIEIDAFPDVEFKGIVKEIGHSAIVNQLGTQDQVTNFKVKVRILDKELRLRPGMTCNVDIQTKTKYNVLAVPLQSVTVRDTSINRHPDLQNTETKVTSDDESKKTKTKKPQSVVFVKDGNKVKMVNVKTGISDNGFIEITEGLKEGEEIISGSFMAISKQLNDGSKIIIDTNKTFKKPIMK